MAMFILCSLAAFRFTFFIHEQIGPFRIFERIRNGIDWFQEEFFTEKSGTLFNHDCPYCISCWITLPFSFFFHPWFLYWMALAASVAFLWAIFERVRE